ncbi:hypothetical protein PUN28_003313 [Cardiocondyla obscurior]
MAAGSGAPWVSSFSWTAPIRLHERIVVDRSVATRLPRTFNVMLRPLLLLCWAATIVSAGSPRNVATNSASAAVNPAENKELANPSSIIQPGQPESNVETKLNLTPSNKDEPTHNSTEKPNASKPIDPSSTTSTSTTTSPITTQKPSTTTEITTTSIPTTPAPTTPVPPPSTGKWQVKENNTVCILIQMAGQLNISYINANNMSSYRVLDIPSNGTVTGTCGKTEQNLTLWWHSPNKTATNNFEIHFLKNETGKDYTIHHFEISLAAEEFPNDNSNKTVTLVTATPQFQTGLSNSYRCYKEQKLNLFDQGTNLTEGFLKVTNLQFQAFRSDNNTIFGLAKDCSFDTPDIVPITVGCALAGMVVIVLIAYLVGRRRSQARGYLSM